MTNQQGQIIFFSVLCIWSGFRSPRLVLFALCMLEIQQISKTNKAIKNENSIPLQWFLSGNMLICYVWLIYWLSAESGKYVCAPVSVLFIEWNNANSKLL